MRLYLPATMHLLALLDRAGELPVTDDVVVAPDASEEAEYNALMTAAGTSALLAGELDPGERRRVVVVAEADNLGLHVALDQVVAVHADVDDIPPGIAPDDLDELGWYATQEIPDLLQG